ncbi:MAG: hypothetical protein ABW166_01200, partial [Sedimenticola sp.]
MQIDLLILMMLGELLLITTVTSILLIVRALIKRKRDRMAIRQLLGRIKKDDERRTTETRGVAQSVYNLEGEALEKAVSHISRGEKLFYQTFMNLYLVHDATALQNLNVEFESAVEPYRALEIPKGSGGAGGGAIEEKAEANFNAEIERLKIENKRLSGELGTTMDTMSRMLNEFSLMFAGGAGSDLDKDKLRQMFEKHEAIVNAEQAAIAELDEPTDLDEVAVEEPEAIDEEAAVDLDDALGDWESEDLDSTVDEQMADAVADGVTEVVLDEPLESADEMESISHLAEELFADGDEGAVE